MTVTHIFHSGFLVELAHTLLLFDYFKGEIPPLDPQKKLYVFVSHKHYDHLVPEIFALEHPNIQYVLFEDIVTQPEPGVAQIHLQNALEESSLMPVSAGANIQTVSVHQRYVLDEVTVDTLLSTDEGCAFVVQAEGKRIYHAGDLNWWHWEGEPEADNQWQDRTFHAELARIAGQQFDCAFLHLDPRQQQVATWGIVDFLKACDCNAVFPAHYQTFRTEMLEYLDKEPLNAYKNRIITAPVWTQPKEELT